MKKRSSYVDRKTASHRKADWESGNCPYCGEHEITKTDLTFSRRKTTIIYTGAIYTCDRCGAVGKFTTRKNKTKA